MFRGYDTERERLVAVKVFKLDLPPQRVHQLVDAFERVIAADLAHPAIAEPIATGITDNSAFLATEYVAADSLDLAVREFGASRPPDALQAAAALAAALDQAAAVNIAHGCLHPRDVLMSSQETRLTGLGVAQALEQVGVQVPVRRPYTAPERITGSQWHRRADVFSLAALVHELLWGRRISAAGEQAAEALTTIAGGDLAALKRAFARALARDPADRYATAIEFVDAVKSALPDAAAAAAPSPSSRKLRLAVNRRAQIDADPLAVLEQPRFADLDIDPEPVKASRGPSILSFADESIEPKPEPPPAAVEMPIEPAVIAADSAAVQNVAQGFSPASDFAELPLREEAHEEEHDPLPAAWRDEPQRFALQPEPEPNLELAESVAAERSAEASRSIQDEEAPRSFHEEEDAWRSIPLASESIPEGEASAEPTPAEAEPTPSEPVPAVAAVGPSAPAAVETPSLFAASHDSSILDRSRSAVWPLVLALGIGVVLGFAGGYAVGLRDRPPATTAVPGREFTEGAVAETPPASNAPRAAAARPEPPAARPPARADARKPEPPPAPAKKPAAVAAAAPAQAQPDTRAGRTQTDAIGRLIVRSTPAGARVLVDDRDAGRTPATVRDLAVGAHRVRLQRDGFNTEERRVVVSRARPAVNMAVTLARAKAAAPAPPVRTQTAPPAATGIGSLSVESRPAGARVFLDGKPIGSTPLSTNDVPAGDHAIRLEHDGYKTWVASVRVGASEQSRVTASLDRQ